MGELSCMRRIVCMTVHLCFTLSPAQAHLAFNAVAMLPSHGDFGSIANAFVFCAWCQ